MLRCPGCPLAGPYETEPCGPARDWPGWCGRLAGEAHQPEGARYWSGRIFDEADKLAGPGRGGHLPSIGLPAGFPVRSAAPGRVRVGLVAPCLHQGGAEAWMASLAGSVDPARVSWRGCAVTAGPASADPAMAARMGESMPVAHGRDAVAALARDCDVLVVWAVPELAGMMAGLARRPEVVSVCHSPLESPWGVRTSVKASGVDRWVAVSELAIPAIPEAARKAIPTSVIWNAVDTSRMEVRRPREAMREAWGIPAGAKVAGYLGRLSEEKDPHAMRRMVEYLPDDWRAVVVGAGAEVIDPHPRLHCVGNDRAAGDVLNAFDVLVVSSAYESCCLTMAEGFWMGVPVVSTEVGLAKMVPGMTRLVPVGADGPTLAAAVLEEWGAPEPGDQMYRVVDAREWAREWLDPGRFGREWTELIVSMSPAPRPGASSMGNGGMNPRPAIDPAVRDRVLGCTHRGAEGGLALLDDEKSCCGGGAERTACSAMKGSRPGRVTLRECLTCQAAGLAIPV